MSLDTAQLVAQAGDDVYLGSILTRLSLWGIVSDIDTPAMMRGSLEVLGDESALVMDALVGPRGPAGQNAPIVKMQWSSSIRDPNDLPKNYLNEDVDIGKAYWIGNQIFIWTGNGDGVSPGRWQIRQMGTAGPAGPVPRISPSLEIVDGPTEIDVTGTTTHPSWHMHVNRREVIGPAGPAAAITLAEDYESVRRPGNFQPMEVGNVLTVIPGETPGEVMWGARNFVRRHARLYTVPEGAFQSFMGSTQRHQILGYQIDPLPYDYVPRVGGHIKAAGVDFSTTPLQIGVEVRLNNAVGGQLIARGHGTAVGWQTISPHFSHSGDQAAATNPDNPLGIVAAGEAATIFVSLVSTGLLGLYIFTNTGAQLDILTVPVDVMV